MKRTLLISVAAVALAAGSTVALSQGGGAGGNTPMANPSAPSGGLETHPGAKGTKGAQEHMTKGAQEHMPAEKQKSAQTPATGKQLPQQGQAEHPSGSKQGAAERHGGGTRQGAAGRHEGGTKQGAAERPMKSSNVSLTTEQKTTIRKTVLTGSAPRVSGHVNFDIKVGVVVPRTVRVAPVPATLISIEPEWRGYMYFVYADEIIIVEPRTLKIIAVVEV